MKTIALMLLFVLHATGLWSHVSATGRSELSNDIVGAPNNPFASTAPLPPLPFGTLPVQTDSTVLNLDAASATAVDSTTGTILYAKNASSPRPIASVTKIVTALVILSRHRPDELVTVPTLPAYQPGDELIGLVPGETYHIGDLVKGALINSGNDSADALAIIDAGTSLKFTDRMNAKMAEWGIEGTHFASPSGLQDTNNFATAASLATIARLALIQPDIKAIVATTSATMTSGAGRVIDLKTTNDLLASGRYYGIKTGYTQAAGECFVGLTRINGHEVTTVVLGAGDRFGATETLTNWIGHAWQWL